MPRRRSTRKNIKKHEPNSSIAPRNPRSPQKKKKSALTGWAAGGHAPKGKVPPGLAKKIDKYLREQEKRKKSK